jgi:hypothetical protein
MKEQWMSDPKAIPVLKKVEGMANHGRHWHFLGAKGDLETVVNDILGIMFEKREAVAMEVDGRYHIIDKNPDLKLAFLPDTAAFPYCEQGLPWTVEVKEIHEWPNGMEAQILGSCHGARVGFYDSGYLIHRSRLQTQEKHAFAVNAIGYLIFPGEVPEGFSEDFCGYMPAGDEAEMDEIQFHSRIEAIIEFIFWDVPMLAFTISLAEIEGLRLKTRVFYAKNDETAGFKVGDRVAGFAWLFGTMV